MFILRTFVRTLRFMGAYGVANVQAAMEYRISFWVQIFTMVANDSLWLFFWVSYFRQYPLVHGWQSTDIVVIWAVAACGFGISMGFFGNARNMATLIMNGGLDAYLGMPRNVLLHVCVSASDPTAWGDMLFSVGAFLLFLHPDLLHIGVFALMVFMAALIFTSFVVIFCSLAFFLGNTEGLALLLFTVIPAGFISFVPLQLLHQFTWPLLGAMVGFTILIISAAAGIFQLGLRRYEAECYVSCYEPQSNKFRLWT